MNFGSIDYWCVFVWGGLRLCGVVVVVFHSKVCNIVIYGEADRALGVNGVVVPLQINARVKVSLPVFSEFIVFGERLFEVYGVSLANIIKAKVVNKQAKHYWVPSVSHEPRWEGALVLVMNLDVVF